MELISRNIGFVDIELDPFRCIRTALLVIVGNCDSINPMDRVCLPVPSSPSSPRPHKHAFSSHRSLTNSDGSPPALVSSTIIGILLFSATLYISLDTSQQWTDTFTLGDELGAKTLFVLTLIWPALYVYALALLSSFFVVRPVITNMREECS
jgi:hypothetical protein